ncbi:tetratricopeptide repeat protein [Laspinema sp. A4]|uniref:tetratricopeptide repeat protein n=1 Tax=Laspinema sp. D2d TaxID=2953686 RepID=UPI0021BB1C5C|nr:tetratricopeptide repeat protein [Laspinema sp. D2d]MCT7986420.1 tetratricopeptide repeat protein [Laspinema sp. D2d]
MAQKHCETGNFALAHTLCREILHREPENLLALHLLGTIAAQEGDNLGAIAGYQKAIKIYPNVPELHYNLANSLKLEGQQAEAIAHYCQAIALRGDYTKALYNLGNLYLEQGEYQGAIAQYQQALALDPQDLQIQTNLGNALKESGDLEAAIAQYRQVCDRSPDSAEFHYNLGVALHDYGDLAEAVACYDRAIAIAPHTVMFHWNRALSLLISGDYRQGFREYEWRWQTETLKPRPFLQPIWDGSPLTGRTILLHSEQGFGDTLQFIRYIPLVAAHGGRVILESYPLLFPLFKQLEGVDIVVLRDEPLPAFDVHAPLMSLPRIFGTTLETIPREIPYLMVRPPRPSRVGRSEQSPPAQVDVSLVPNDQNASDSPLLKGGWGGSLLKTPAPNSLVSPSFKIGIVWAANHENPTAIKRSCSVSYFIQLVEDLKADKIIFYSLQKDSGELTQISPKVPIQDLSPQLNHFLDTAEVMAELDLIITVDTAVAHLAGTLGKPAWVLLPFAPDWRWFLHRTDSPWYPTLRLFRQRKPGDWQSVFEAVKQALIEILNLTENRAEMPQNGSAKLGRGIAAHQEGDLTTAERLYRQVLEQMPNHPVALTNLGMLLKAQGNSQAAVDCYHQALPYAPQEVGLHYNLGNALWELGNREAAIAQFHRVIGLQPNHVDGYNNLGMVLHELGELEPAIPHFDQAITLNPQYAQGYNNLGLVLHDLGRVEEAIACYNTALHLQPDYSEAHNNRGIALLIQGDLRQGFRDYEWRWRVKAAPDLPPIPAPFWDGSDLQGKTILLHAEQGLGDCIQFIRYGALLVQRGGRVVALVNQPLVRLFASVPGIDRVSAYWSDLAPIDVWIPLLSLPHLLGTTLTTIPGEVPYLTPTHLAPVILDAPEFKVGIVWAGNPHHKGDRTRSCPLRYFLPLLNIRGVKWYSLQKGQEETRIRQQNLPIQDLAPHLQDLADTAAVIAQLDLVITVDTSIAHLAGALGKPVWVALSYAPDWRWMLKRSDSPWYPTMRLFRQEERGDWQGVFDEVAQSLTEIVATRVVLPEPPTISPEFALARQDYEAGNFADAQRRCRVLLRQYPTQAQGWQLLGAIAHQGGKLNTAVGYYKQAIVADSRYLPAYINLGAALRSLGKTGEAISYLAQAIAVDSHCLPAHYNLGNALSDEGNFREAIAHYRQVIAIDAHHSQAHYHLGNALKEVGNVTEAVAYIQAATTLDPNYTEAHNTLGTLFLKAGRITEAIACFQRAIALDSQYIDAQINLGTAFQEQHQTTEAIAAYNRALQIQSDSAEAHLNLALSLLTAGDLRGGFAEYEWRWRVKGYPTPPHFEVPRWEGADLTGKTLLLYGEQGLGDTLQFIRYAPLLAQQGIRVVALVSAPLVFILKSVPGIENVSSNQQELEPFHSWVPLMSLPRILGINLTTIPAIIPYIQPPYSRQLNLESAAPFKIGIVWAGNPNHKMDYKRSCSLDVFKSFLTVPGVQFYSLQKGKAGEIWQGMNLPIQDLGPSLHDFADTAAAIAQLDLIITVDTSVAHLAGAMGKPTWLLLAYTPDWRWGLEGSDSPWYPTLRLFRQQQPGDWQKVGDRIATELRQTVENSGKVGLPKQNPSLLGKKWLEGEVKMNRKSMITESSCDRTQPLSKTPQNPLRLGLAWPINQMTGWGIYGTNLTLQLQKNPGYEPMLLLQPDTTGVVNPLVRSQLKPVCDRYQNLEQLRNQNPGKPIWCDFPVLHALGNNFISLATTQQLGGKQNIGLIFFEDTNLTPEKRQLAQDYLLIIAGSTWNAEVLKSQGITTVQALPQGIDPTLFHPAPKSNLFGDRFVIFSGGKLEYRKGQDIVIAAFKAFQKRHPEALLITAWHNFWPQFMRGLETTGHVKGLPQVGADKRLNIPDWLLNNGLNPESFIDIGAIPNYLMPQIIREADCALFTNRCEGGTNLVAMETMACGIPTILSANTGHLDLIDPNHCYALKTQKPVQSTPHFLGVEGWGESDIEEILEMLETLYSNREIAQGKGMAAVQFMQQWTWENQVNRLLEILGEIL